jgi:hypothetical protein
VRFGIFESSVAADYREDSMVAAELASIEEPSVVKTRGLPLMSRIRRSRYGMPDPHMTGASIRPMALFPEVAVAISQDRQCKQVAVNVKRQTSHATHLATLLRTCRTIFKEAQLLRRLAVAMPLPARCRRKFSRLQ